MTELLFRDDAYLKSAPAELVDLTDNGGLIFNQTVFYPIGGGQPSDVGELISDDLNLKVREVRKGDQGKVVFFVEGSTEGIQIGQKFQQKIDWPTRYGYMKIHTALHLLSVVIPLGVTGGSIGSQKGRLDFEMPEPLENKEILNDALKSKKYETYK